MKRGRHGEPGQATLEATLALPVVLLALLAIVQVGLVVRDAMAVWHAAREGVRAAAVSGDDRDADEAVRRAAGPLEAGRIDVSVDPAPDQRRRGEPVTVFVRYRTMLRVPVIGRMAPSGLLLRGNSTMRLEVSP